MCHSSCISFGSDVFTEETVAGKSFLEVGSYNINGSLRSVISPLGPTEYLGVDCSSGPGVDEICDGCDIVARYGENRWDCIICTEVMEHVKDWRSVVSNLKRALKSGGQLLLTTRSFGFPYHAHPGDYWRYEPEDIKTIFSEFFCHRLESDPELPGVFLLATKPIEFTEADLTGVQLYSMQSGDRLYYT